MGGAVDDNYIWQRRIQHGIRYQKGQVPFPDCVAVGLEFNASLERKDKLDLSQLSNGVMLELCHFAKTVTRSEKYFLFEMLEFNFDLGVDSDDERMCYEFATRVHNKVKVLKEQIKMRPQRWKEAFTLPDSGALKASAGTEATERYYPRRNKALDTSCLTGGNPETSEGNGVASGASAPHTPSGVVKLKANAYPLCEELGVSVMVHANDSTRRKLQPSLLTSGVMLELLAFSRVLCGGHTRLVDDLVKLNFGHQVDKFQFRLQLSRLMEKKHASITDESKAAFRKAPFKIFMDKRQPRARKRRRVGAEGMECFMIDSKRRGTRWNGGVKELPQDSELSYMCPVDFEAEMHSGLEAGAETELLDVKRDDEEVSVPAEQPWEPELHTADDGVSDLFFEDKDQGANVKLAKQQLWTRRAARSKHVLKSSRVRDLFASCRQVGLDFNVGSGIEQNLNLRLLTNGVLVEVYKFASAMTKSLCNYLSEILTRNFCFASLDEACKHNLLCYFISKEKSLQNHPDRTKMEFLSSTFQFPEVYNIVDICSVLRSKQQTSQDTTASHSSQQMDMEPYPFCRKLGLDFWSTEERAMSHKLDLTDLTTGAVLEIFVFVRELCGTVRQIVADVLEHNFILDLESGAAEVLQRWLAMQKSFMKKLNPTQRTRHWSNTVVFSPQMQIGRNCEDSAGSEQSGEIFGGNARRVKRVSSFHICKEIGLDLDVGSKSEVKAKLDLHVLTRGVLLEVHRYVELYCHRYVPSLYEILDFNFDLSSQNHRKVEFAWSIASQVLAMAPKTSRKENYLNKVFELPFEVPESPAVVCKEEPDAGYCEPDAGGDGGGDIVFVRALKPVDIEVEIE